MDITATQLQTHHKALIDALKRGESVTISYHGQPLGIVHPIASEDNIQQVEAMNQFFGMHGDLPSENIEDTLRVIRKGRRKQL